MKPLICIISSLLLLAACSHTPTTVDSSLGAAHSEKWEAMLNAGNIEGLLKVYTKDTRVLPPNGEMKMGLAAVREEFGAMINAGMKIDLKSIDSKAVGDVAYNLGTYELRIGNEIIDTGKWIETWHRGADGTWRISNDIWNSDHPSVAEEKTKDDSLDGHAPGG